ncbi:MAG: threonylcarbamoyl-AMP synthase [Acidimicrobiia bacterium]|nr:threonylcarbamoyl-AMP synthase [Acidimicrobiia bacterium]
MKTEIVRVDRDHPDADAIARAAACLRRGGLVAFPTETVYGLGVHALDRAAVLRLFEAKQRPANDPLIVHVASIDAIVGLVAEVPGAAHQLAATFWPGPLTLVMRRAPTVPDEVTAGLDTVAVRVPSHPVARALLEAARLPIAAPSANLFSRPSPTRAEHVLEDLDGRIDMIVDGGPTDVGVESTVVDVTVDPPVILRPGMLGIDTLRDVIPDLAQPPSPLRGVGGPGASGQPRSPGLLAKHYAPTAPLTLFRGDATAVTRALRHAAQRALAQRRRVGVLATSGDVGMLRDLPVSLADLGPDDNMARIAARLYAALRELDAQRVDVILARDPTGGDDLARAIRDRLQRAAAEVVDV